MASVVPKHSSSISKEDKNVESYDKTWLKGTSAETVLSKQKIKTNINDFSDPAFKKISRVNGKINSMSMSELVDSLKELSLETKYVRKK